MERGKRKREDEVKKSSGKNKPKEAEMVTEEEVDEFFTILRRMHVAVKYFEKSSSEVDQGLRKKWRKALEREVLEGVESTVSGVKEVKMRSDHQNVEEIGGLLDLNAIPEPEGDEE